MIEFMEQPLVYYNEDELIKWLTYDLNEQRRLIAEKKGIDKNEVKDEELELNIGYKDFLKNVEIKFDFDFHFNSIISKLLDKKYICPYKVNCINTAFSSESNFSNAKFSGESNFRSATFSDKANFRFATFSGFTYFGYATFKNKVDFNNIKIENTLSFENIKFNEKSYLDFNDINYDISTNKFIEPNQKSVIKIVNTVINGRVDFNNVKIKQIDFKGSNIMGDGVLNRINFEAECANWETATFLKHEEIKRNNTIKALEYKAIEKDLYSEELKTKKLSREVLAVRFSICLSKLSNNHGQDWLKAVIFTLGAFFGCFAIYYMPVVRIYYFSSPLSYISFLFDSNFYSALLEYFVPINYNSVIEYVRVKEINPIIRAFGVFIYMTGKIAVGYGMVEIVQAFRKLNNK